MTGTGPSQTPRARTLTWGQAATLLYGDWGAGKAYILGLAFAITGYASLPILLLISIFVMLIGLSYLLIWRYYPNGSGVYRVASAHGRLLAVTGAWLLAADLSVTAALGIWECLRYLAIPPSLTPGLALFSVVVLGSLNWLGIRFSARLALVLAIPAFVGVLLILALAVPHLSTASLDRPQGSLGNAWTSFVFLILAMSGVETVAALTGIFVPDKGSSPDNPGVGRTACKAILPVALEVCLTTFFLGWAMLSIPHDLAPILLESSDDMLRFLGEHYGTLAIGHAGGAVIGWAVGIVVAILLLSCANTAIVGLTGLIHALAGDGEAPPSFRRLNRHGVPIWPLVIAVGLPALTLLLTISRPAVAHRPADALHFLTGLYALGIVGAMAITLGSCSFDSSITAKRYHRWFLFGVFLVLLGAELTLAKMKPDALFYTVCTVAGGLLLRQVARKRAGGVVPIPVPVQTTPGPRPLPSAAAETTTISDGRYVFVSYKREELSRVRELLALIGDWGYQVWFDQGILGGTEWDSVIAERIRGCHLVLLLASPSALASKHVRREIKYADSCNRPLLTIVRGEIGMEHGLEMLLQQYQMLDERDPMFLERLRVSIRHHLTPSTGTE